ncbi:MAG TPA: nucleoside recognition domain-containing protein [Myxococcota bacterium]|nr:nucleoside recognition domain-containing protein [Myxococcota bacterium]
MLNWIWLGLILGSILYAGFHGRMEAVQDAIFASAKDAVQLVIGLVGIMVFMLGVMRVAFDAGLRDVVARGLAPLLRRLFPDVPPDHPAMGAMVMNLASNVFGLGNAATPFGLKAMVELAKLNPHPGSASNPMVLFLAINATAVTLLPPLGTIGVRAAAGSADPFAIWLPTLIATTCSTLTAVAVYYLLRDLPRYRPRELPTPPGDAAPGAEAERVEIPEPQPWQPMGPGLRVFVLGCALALGVALAVDAARLVGEQGLRDGGLGLVRSWLFPLLLAGLLLAGVAGRVPVYESAIEGAREGLQVAARIVPYLVAILVAVAMFRASGALDLLIRVLDPVTSAFGFPAEALPMALLRPLSGSGSFAVMSEILKTHGPDSFVGLLTSTLQGSTETTFYVLALYLGAARVRDGRHALAACLIGDLAGFAGATAACHLFFG